MCKIVSRADDQVCPIGAFAQAVGYALMCWGGPFILFVLAYIPNGFGLGLQGESHSSSARTSAHTTKTYDQTHRSILSLLD
jgi:hypothetical protein